MSNYDTHGLLDYSVDSRGVKTDFGYDGLNRIKTIIYTGETGYQTPKVTYTYDEARNDSNNNPYSNNGRLTKVETEAISIANQQETPAIVHLYDYDKVGQIVNHTQTIGAESYDLKYAYNLAGQLTSQTYPSGKVVTNTIDDHGTLQTVADAQETYLNGITINNQGLMSGATLGNGTSETFSYNDRFQMTSQSLLKGTEVLQKYDYSYGDVNTATGAVDAAKNNGQLGKIDSYIGTSQQWSQRFGYDELGRLKEASEYKLGDNNQLSYKQVFDYDRFGNLYRKAANNPTGSQQNPLSFEAIEDTHINKSNNRLTDSTTYDDAGQVTTDNKFRNLNFAYDGNGRRIKTTATNTDASTVYDALGNRVATRSYDVWRYMIYDAFGKLVAEYGVKSEGLGGVKYVQSDWQDSVRTVTNSNGFVVARTDHQAFGGEVGYGVGTRSIEQGYSVDKVTIQSYGLTEEDATGQKHAWARKLETESGRWTRPDPYNGSMRLGNPQSFNRYSYVTNDPLNYIDPSGLDGEDHGPVVGIVNVTDDWAPLIEALSSLISGRLQIEFVPESPVTERTPNISVVGNPRPKNDCQILRDDPKFKKFAKKIWGQTKKDGREAGGLFGNLVDTGENHTRGEPSHYEPFHRRGATRRSMGVNFAPWIRSRRVRDRGKVFYKYLVHTHPNGSINASTPRTSSNRTGDSKVSEELGILGVIVTGTKIAIYNETGKNQCVVRRRK